MKKPSLLCIGHRGAMGYEPENTLRSIRRALALGARCVEIDVYRVDDQLVVIHDDHLKRTTDGTGLVTEQTFQYLRSLDAGAGERIPTLDEILDLIEGKAGINIELKGPETAAPVATSISARVKAGWNRDVFLVSSFDHRKLIHMHELDGDIRLGVICTAAQASHLEFAQEIGAFSIHPARLSVNAQYVRDAHRIGLAVYPFTVNEPDDIIRMVELGVDGVFTNYPDRVVKHYAQSRGAAYWTGR